MRVLHRHAWVFPVTLGLFTEMGDDFVGDAFAKVLGPGEGQAISLPGFWVDLP